MKFFFSVRSLLFFLLVPVLFACKKDEDPTIRGKWDVDSITIKEYFNNQLDDSYSLPGDGISMDFQSNGNLVIDDGSGSTTTVNYTVSGNNLTIDGESYEIRNLTDSKATLYYKETYGPGEYDETFIYLER